MPHARSMSSPGVLAIATLLIAGCDKSAPAAKHDSAARVADSAHASPTTPPAASTWNGAAGPVLLVQGETSGETIVVLPNENDSATTLTTLGKGSTAALLVARDGASSIAQLGIAPTARESDCRVWPVRNARGDGVLPTWAIGFLSRDVGAIALDSIEALSSRDSLALTAEAARLSSAVTAVSPSFEGLRFVVHDVRRFESAPGVQTLVAHLIRRVNQEANPQEEQTLIIAERDSGVTTGPYQLLYADRTNGSEEEVVAPEVIAAVRIGGIVTLVIARDSENGVSYELLERDANRHWRIRWISAPTRCG